MKKRLYRALTPSLIILLTVIASGSVAGFSTLRSSRDVVERYVSVWEEEIARNLLLKGDAGLFEKIRIQISDLASDVATTGDDAKVLQATGSCFAAQTLNVTLYGTPAGELLICRSPQKLFFRSLTSPVFAFGILAGILLAVWLARRASREETDRALNDLALRVAHDIRSPIMALNIAAGQAQVAAKSGDIGASRDVERLIGAATNRISIIADELLQQGKNSKKSTPISTQVMETKLLGVAIQDLIKEKQILASSDLVFELKGPRTMEGVPPATSSPELDRVVSNLLQNAVDATAAETHSEKTHRISVDACETSTEISITIRDNGVGIPADVLSRLGESGLSYGKENGNGIGFSSARAWARKCGGDLDIRSLVGTGTEVRLTIPRR